VPEIPCKYLQSSLKFIGPGDTFFLCDIKPHKRPILSKKKIYWAFALYIHTTIQKFGIIKYIFFKEVPKVHQGCIYWIKYSNKKKKEILLKIYL